MFIQVFLRHKPHLFRVLQTQWFQKYLFITIVKTIDFINRYDSLNLIHVRLFVIVNVDHCRLFKIEIANSQLGHSEIYEVPKFHTTPTSGTPTENAINRNECTLTPASHTVSSTENVCSILQLTLPPIKSVHSSHDEISDIYPNKTLKSASILLISYRPPKFVKILVRCS